MRPKWIRQAPVVVVVGVAYEVFLGWAGEFWLPPGWEALWHLGMVVVGVGIGGSLALLILND